MSEQDNEMTMIEKLSEELGELKKKYEWKDTAYDRCFSDLYDASKNDIKILHDKFNSLKKEENEKLKEENKFTNTHWKQDLGEYITELELMKKCGVIEIFRSGTKFTISD